MFNLIHNADFVIAAFFVFLVIFVATYKRYSHISNSNRLFFYILFASLLSCIFDFVLNLSETYLNIFPVVVMYICRLGYNVGSGILTSLAYQYVRSRQDNYNREKKNVVDWLIITTTVALVILGLINFFTGYITGLDENGQFIDGPLQKLQLILPAFNMIVLLFVAIKNRKHFSDGIFGGMVFFIIVAFGSIALEFSIDSKVLFSMYGTMLGTVWLQIYLETPDYEKLLIANEEERKAKQAAEEAKELADNMRLEAEKARVIAETAYAESQASRQEALASQKLAEEAKEMAIAASTAKSTFLARMSHEIRTPMNAILGLNEMIAKESTEKNVVGYANDSAQACENLLNIINDILDFSKIESGKLELLDVEYSLKELLKEEFTLFSFKAREKNLKLVFDIDKEIPNNLVGDDVRIKQILTNLLSNAIKYTDNGTVTLKVTLEGVGRSSSLLKFVVKDTGIGIKDEDIGKLYDAFERIEEKRNRNIQGTGLGINICVQLLTLMGSKLLVDSVYGLGSQFSFSIRQTMVNKDPIGDFNSTEEQRIVEESKKALIKAPNAKLLVVDDNIMNLKVFAGLLKDTQIKIDCVSSGEEALQKTKETKYDIIFMDHLMPEMDGIETFNAIKAQQDGLNSETIEIALTANAIKGALEEYIGYGFIDAVFKPATQDELNEKLWKYLDSSLVEN